MNSSLNHPLRLDAVTERLTLTDQVYTSIKKAIIDGDLGPGTRLREVEVATSLGASRTPVREALSRLEQDGLVQSLKTGGSIVVELSIDEMREIFDLIQVLETYAIRIASVRITAKQLEKLESVCTRAEQAAKSDYDKLGELNRTFHELIIDAAGSQRLKITDQQPEVRNAAVQSADSAIDEISRTVGPGPSSPSRSAENRRCRQTGHVDGQASRRSARGYLGTYSGTGGAHRANPMNMEQTTRPNPVSPAAKRGASFY